jgi:hypothetical protein
LKPGPSFLVFGYNWMRLRDTAMCDEQVHRFTGVEVVVKFAVRPDARKRPPIHEAFFPKAAQAPERHVFIAADKAPRRTNCEVPEFSAEGET